MQEASHTPSGIYSLVHYVQYSRQILQTVSTKSTALTAAHSLQVNTLTAGRKGQPTVRRQEGKD